MTNEEKRALFSRIHALVAAYAYEILDTPIILDHTYDHYVAPAAQNTVDMKLGLYDEVEFSKDTGMWVPREDKKLEELTKLVIEACDTKNNRDEICHYPEFCELINKIYNINLFC